ncbi:hypothetical protein JCM11641_005717 [Rhodosporidiobolus odoratus]
MSTFSKRTFDAAAYAASRPTYPPQLFQHILASLPPPATSSSASPRTLLDLGCGPGVSTFDWAPHLQGRFDRVIGTDPSQGMVEAATKILQIKRDRGELGKEADWRFEVARSDDLHRVIQDESVDLAIAGQAAHWFDASATYKELARVLKPGGAFAFWGYGEFFFPSRPELSALITPYSAGTLGPFWEQPGRSIVEALLTPFPFPSSVSVSTFNPATYTRSFFLRPSGGPPPFSQPTSPATLAADSLLKIEVTRELLLKRTWGIEELRAYLRTWSAAHSYDETHRQKQGASTGDRAREGQRQEALQGLMMKQRQEDRDCVEVFLDELKRAGLKEGEGVEVAWEVGVMMGRRKDAVPE